MTTVISVENLSKIYRLGLIGTGTITTDFNVWWAKMRGKPNPLLKIGEKDHGNRDGEELWALRDVSFKVEQGEVLGIIGRNGAGKSTLLKILSRTTAPTSGKIRVKGRIASLLEVGTGFHPELTGRENIYLNGAILGMKRDEITRKFDEIVDFSEVEKFIDTPVKRYSSGMYVRLAFAVAAHLDPEILVVDEVLAVGDATFQKKCLGKMGDVAQEGRTVLFVSHNMVAVQSLCTQAILLEFGRISYSGEVDSTVTKYLNQIDNNEIVGYEILPSMRENDGNGKLKFEEWWIEDDASVKSRAVRSCHKCMFRITYKTGSKEPLSKVSVTLTIKDNYGRPLLSGSTWLLNSDFSSIPPTGFFSCVFENLPLAPGVYILHLYCSVQNDRVERITNAGTFEVIADDVYGVGRIPPNHHGVLIVKDFYWTVDPCS
ncbi:MAG: ABC transporter ATP-binding protein [Anaerolineales bacterium]|jgi:lipopolysaccharide transport system ATP-binding protein|nr:ABC transporter ATP-binding protein [Anaerolineales bacterium]GER80052.1 ABC transporter ATP-binding protein [Candidatus Denitrolinea symbiosum]